MKRITSLIAVFGFFIWSTANASVVPEGYSTVMESSNAQIVTKHNGQAIYIENSSSDNKIFIDTTTDEVIFWFSDASYIKIDPATQMITQLGRHRPRLGNAKMDTYHINTIGSQPVWDLTTENRQLWERFTEFSSAVSGPLSASHTQNSLIASSKQIPGFLEETKFVAQATDSCEAERDNALHGYNGHTTLEACYKTEDAYLLVSAMSVLGFCASPAAAFGTCVIAIGTHYTFANDKQEKIYQCNRAKDVADRDLRICEEAANDAGGGWVEDPGTGGGVNNGGIPAPILRCAEWIQLKNTTVGDVTYCSRWTLIP